MQNHYVLTAHSSDNDFSPKAQKDKYHTISYAKSKKIKLIKLKYEMKGLETINKEVRGDAEHGTQCY